MRCFRCGWLVKDERCPCGATAPALGPVMVPVGTKVIARPGRGPSMRLWITGEVVAHQGRLHQVQSGSTSYWVEAQDLIPATAEREPLLTEGTRVWALWLDGRWYPGTIDDCEASLRHVTFDDGDSAWIEPWQAVLLATESAPADEGHVVMARHESGNYFPARIEQKRGAEFRVQFADGDEAWIPGDDLYTFPPSPFLD